MKTPSRINAADSRALLEKKQDIKIIDVRTKAEYDEKHIPGSEHVSVEDIIISGIPYSKETPVLIACNFGLMKSQIAAQKLSDRGFTDVYILDGGLSAWFSETVKTNPVC